jgi:spermidine synthase
LGSDRCQSVLEAYGIRSDVVEIDPDVVRFAQTYFDFKPTGTIHVEDARGFISRTKQTYDIVVHDTFSGGTTPTHLLSLEVLRAIRGLLRPNGILVLNFVGYGAGLEAAAPEMVWRTLQVIFPHVRVFRDEPPSDAPGNLIFFASESAIELSIPADARSNDPAELSTMRSMQEWEVLRSVPPGPIVTDRSNPLARLQLSSAEAHFRAMNELLPRDVWLR